MEKEVRTSEFLADYHVFETLDFDKPNSKTCNLEILQDMLAIFNQTQDWSSENLSNVLMNYSTLKELKLGKVILPINVAVNGQTANINDCVNKMCMLGKNETLNRIEKCTEWLKINMQ